MAALNRRERGEKTRQICGELRISEATFYNWKARYGAKSFRTHLKSRSP